MTVACSVRDRNPSHRCCAKQGRANNETKTNEHTMALSLQFEIPRKVEVASSLADYDKRLRDCVKNLLPFFASSGDESSTSTAIKLAVVSQALNFVLVRKANAIADVLKGLKNEFIQGKNFTALAQAFETAGCVVTFARDKGENNAHIVFSASVDTSELQARDAVKQWLAALVERGTVLDVYAARTLVHLLHNGVPPTSKLGRDFFEPWKTQKGFSGTIVKLTQVAAEALECAKIVLPKLVAFRMAQTTSAAARREVGTDLKGTLADLTAEPEPVPFDNDKHDLWDPSPDELPLTMNATVFYVTGPFNDELLAASGDELLVRKPTVVNGESRHKVWPNSAQDLNCEQLADLALAMLPPSSSTNGSCSCCGLRLQIAKDSVGGDVAVEDTSQTGILGKRERPSSRDLLRLKKAPTGSSEQSASSNSSTWNSDGVFHEKQQQKGSFASSSHDETSPLFDEPAPKRLKSQTGHSDSSRSTAIEVKEVPTKALGSQRDLGKNRRSDRTLSPALEALVTKQPHNGASTRPLPTSTGQQPTSRETSSFDPLRLTFGTQIELFLDRERKWRDYRALFYFHGSFRNKKGLVLVAHPEGLEEDEYTWIFLDERGLEHVKEWEGKIHVDKESKYQAKTWFNVDSPEFPRKTPRSWQIKRGDVVAIRNGPWIREGRRFQAPTKRNNWAVDAQFGKIKVAA